MSDQPFEHEYLRKLITPTLDGRGVVFISTEDSQASSAFMEALSHKARGLNITPLMWPYKPPIATPFAKSVGVDMDKSWPQGSKDLIALIDEKFGRRDKEYADMMQGLKQLEFEAKKIDDIFIDPEMEMPGPMRSFSDRYKKKRKSRNKMAKQSRRQNRK